MEPTIFLRALVILPVLTFLVTLFIKEKSETLLSRVVNISVGLHLASLLCFVTAWIIGGHPILDEKDIVLFKNAEYEFFIDFYFDKVTATYLLVGAFLTWLVTIYSKFYLHREKGYKRFFCTIMFFYTGYNITVMSGNMETLFLGWEILGISSFLLIAFYRDRYLPVKNAVKVFSIYRIGDVGIILAMWLSHHIWHENITFFKLNNYQLVHEQLQTHNFKGIIIAIMILITAAAKSAQLPFSTWLPRAMEGPTPSSAIFYGSLSVHMGVFLLIRTHALWEHQYSVRVVIGALGVITAIITTGIARVQSSVKSQIAYSSIAQIGLIFLEISLGWLDVALIHFAGNAFLRTYQLLVSPSVVTYLIREQFYSYHKVTKKIESFFPKRLAYSFYILCLKEFNLDSMMYKYLWNPLKFLGRKLDFLTPRNAIVIFIITFGTACILLFNEEQIPENAEQYLPIICAFLGLVMVFKSFTERKNVLVAWILIIMNHCWVALAISFNEHYDLSENLLYLSGILVFGAVGIIIIRRLQKKGENIDLDRFHGLSFEYPVISLFFLIACLGASGFPITPTFIGEDLIYSHIHEDHAVLAFFVTMSFILDGLSIMRIYARVFMGPNVKSVYETAYRSS
jgi:NADH-quinone oxidoreductase subunit L